jgi:hypothetical protein
VSFHRSIRTGSRRSSEAIGGAVGSEPTIAWTTWEGGRRRHGSADLRGGPAATDQGQGALKELVAVVGGRHALGSEGPEAVLGGDGRDVDRLHRAVGPQRVLPLVDQVLVVGAHRAEQEDRVVSLLEGDHQSGAGGAVGCSVHGNQGLARQAAGERSAGLDGLGDPQRHGAQPRRLRRDEAVVEPVGGVDGDGSLAAHGGASATSEPSAQAVNRRDCAGSGMMRRRSSTADSAEKLPCWPAMMQVLPGWRSRSCQPLCLHRLPPAARPSLPTPVAPDDVDLQLQTACDGEAGEVADGVVRVRGRRLALAAGASGLGGHRVRVWDGRLASRRARTGREACS